MNVLYFASLKESLGLASEVIVITADITVNDLRVLLIEKYGEQHFPNNILCAVNHEIATSSTQINDTDEVAFYPPVTGG
ncbi:molybdopterin converting factor subunit 1 [Bathymodiolus septemdierum thioautotrophic gill symbiont]|uniref:Molybdopterin synthase sulfur carrier subunit n=1 Tax=endosymbiont of Bathymodiolus septemdierum str. Myojin knoll TaxID=1303921 RepID=A0A0P0USF3_9GAMM|nr:molybdopterin converting factor subunit 1 [Bathymodiolus septemdierum thioautotrophic gill symbiont]BAS68043.1 molybdopterin synthase sulfur carrier subunit [endosymbiont of Bathymodiolus septemdierum str. Myojin knoll]